MYHSSVLPMDGWHVAVLQRKRAPIEQAINQTLREKQQVMETLNAEDVSVEEASVNKHEHDWLHMPCSLVWAVHNAWSSMTPLHCHAVSMMLESVSVVLLLRLLSSKSHVQLQAAQKLKEQLLDKLDQLAQELRVVDDKADHLLDLPH